MVVPRSTSPSRWLVFVKKSIRSVSVVLPASMWATMPILRIFSSRLAISIVCSELLHFCDGANAKEFKAFAKDAACHIAQGKASDPRLALGFEHGQRIVKCRIGTG